MKTISKSTLYLSSLKKVEMGLWPIDHINRLITLLAITLSGFHCTSLRNFDYQVFLLRQRACDLPDLHQQLHHPLLLPEVLPVHLPDELLQTKHLKSNQISKVNNI
jgi:hypothetical protein